MARPRPRITRRDIGPDRRTSTQKRRAARDIVILASYAQGLSLRLIAAGIGLDPKIVRDTLDRLGYPPPPENP